MATGLVEVIKGNALEPQSIIPDKARGGEGRGQWLLVGKAVWRPVPKAQVQISSPAPRHRFKPHPLLPRHRFKLSFLVGTDTGG